MCEIIDLPFDLAGQKEVESMRKEIRVALAEGGGKTERRGGDGCSKRHENREKRETEGKMISTK